MPRVIVSIPNDLLVKLDRLAVNIASGMSCYVRLLVDT